MERHRIDNWLKHVCLFRHRAEATEACRGGKVRINGVRAKPAAKVKEGDLIEFFNGTLYRRVIVGSVPEKQVSR
ncbi:MAG TPA: S4 domain-containing protein, partial [Thermoanaerobaculia bacterium]|nr:S4 domain-containing protein [Thermoanaerobaculia bacterium]